MTKLKILGKLFLKHQPYHIRTQDQCQASKTIESNK